MSVTGKPMPSTATLLGAVDEHARRTVRAAQAELAPVVAANVPRGRTGNVAGALRPRVSRTATGAQVSVQAPRGKPHDQWATIADVVRWVTRGTGVRRAGPGGKRPIRAKSPGGRMVLPGGAVRYRVAGQRPNPFMARIADAGTQRFERTAVSGARSLERVVGRLF